MDDEELDDALEQELAASIHRRVDVPPTTASADVQRTGRSSPVLSVGFPSIASWLTFEFPGWGVDMSHDPKRRVVQHCSSLAQNVMHDDKQGSPDECMPAKSFWGHANNPGKGCFVYNLPDEIMINVLKRLCIQELCSAILTCHWWQHLGSRDEVWEQFDAGDNVHQKPLPSLSKWATVKNCALLAQLHTRVAFTHAYFCKGFEHLRSALHSWWSNRKHVAPYSSKAIFGLLHKLTSRDWTLVYEFFGVIFAERADCLATQLMCEIEKEAGKGSWSVCPFFCDHKGHGGKIHGCSGDILNVLNKDASSFMMGEGEGQALFEGRVGIVVWKHVCGLWKQYRHWLMLVFEHCPDLNYQVMLDKARATRWMTTPNVYDKGVLCFRSQVLLRYGPRRVLQLGYSWLSIRVADGLASEIEFGLLRSIHHLLQEVDVRDDTMAPKTFTQSKLWRCFPVMKSYARNSFEEAQQKLLESH